MFEPRIVAYICNWSWPPEIDIVKHKGIEGHPKIIFVRVPCIGRIDPVIILETFAMGIDGVLVVGCPSPDCHYIGGDLHAEQKVDVLKKLVSLIGLEPKRLCIDWIYPSDTSKLATTVDDFRNNVIATGQSPLAPKKPNEKILLNILAAENATREFRSRALAGREIQLTTTTNVYGEVLQPKMFDDLISQVLEEEFIRHKICLLAKKEPLSVKELAELLGVDPAEVLRQVVDMRRKGMISLDHIEETTPFYKTLSV